MRTWQWVLLIWVVASVPVGILAGKWLKRIREEFYE